MSSNCPIVPLEKINSFIVVEAGQIILCPTAKSASTLLKRVACLLQGQTPIWRCSTWESRPALAVHDPLVNGLKTLAHYSSEDQADMLTSSEWLRLAVTRHPAERLVSFWFDKIFLQDPYYQELSSLIRQKPDLLPHSAPPDFDQFLIYLHHHWSLLSQDCHLTPQSSVLCIPSVSYSHHLDRDNLCSDLQAILVNRVNSDTLELVNHELKNYKSHYRQELSSLWSKLYTNDLLDLVQNLYHDDLSFFSYDLPVVASNSSSLAPLAIVQGCLADASRQVQERNQQIGFLQAEIRRLHAQVNDPAAWLQLPAIATALPGESQVSQHHTDDHEFAVLYQLLAAGQPNQLLERLSHILKKHSLSGQLLGEIFYLEGVANNLLGNFESALRLFERAQDCGFITPYLLFNGGNSCRSLGHQEDAQRLFSQALELQPDFPECKHNLCLSLYDSRDYQRAEVGFRTLLRDHPSYFQAAFCLGNLLRDLKRYPEAVEAYKLSIEHSPQYVDAWNNLGLAYGDLKRNDLAISAYLQCLSIDAAFPHARQNIAQAYILKKDYHSALGHFELLAALNYGVNQNVLALQGQINCLLELGCYEAALERADLCSEHERVRLMARLHVLPVLYDSTDQLNTIRVRWSQDLKALYGLLTDISSADDDYPDLWMHAWSLTNFYLAYQMQDDRELQEIYASCLVLILKQRLAKFMQARTSDRGSFSSANRRYFPASAPSQWFDLGVGMARAIGWKFRLPDFQL
jgi:tetratricopeptide (TPR) repeat protein